MDAFEHIASRYFEAQGYWTRVGVKIALTKEEKRDLGNPSMPRPEVDIIGFKPHLNELLIIECKSYLDSDGVRIENFDGTDSLHKERFKMFNRDSLRKLVTAKLIEQLRQEGLLLAGDPKVNYGVVAGNIKAGHESKLIEKFQEMGWLLVTPSALARGLRKFASRGYENDIVTMVIKILERNVGE